MQKDLPPSQPPPPNLPISLPAVVLAVRCPAMSEAESESEEGARPRGHKTTSSRSTKCTFSVCRAWRTADIMSASLGLEGREK
jgi:hypothetical protein